MGVVVGVFILNSFVLFYFFDFWNFFDVIFNFIEKVMIVFVMVFLIIFGEIDLFVVLIIVFVFIVMGFVV